MGRTHLQDAVPIRFSQEFESYATVLKRDLARIKNVIDDEYKERVIKLFNDSNMYSQNEIDDAIKVIVDEFQGWKGCTLTSIYYGGDELSKAHQEWADRNDADEVIVLLSSFDVDESGGDGSLNPNSTYDDWMWILVRKNGGQWMHIDHGY